MSRRKNDPNADSFLTDFRSDGASGGGVVAKEEAIVDHGREHAAQERSDPVDAVVLPVVRGERQVRTEGARRIHGRAGEGRADEIADRHGEADREARAVAERSAGVDYRGEYDGYDDKSENGFERHAMQAREVRREVGRAERHRPPYRLGKDRAQRVSAGCGAEKLRDCVADAVYSA